MGDMWPCCGAYHGPSSLLLVGAWMRGWSQTYRLIAHNLSALGWVLRDIVGWALFLYALIGGPNYSWGSRDRYIRGLQWSVPWRCRWHSPPHLVGAWQEGPVDILCIFSWGGSGRLVMPRLQASCMMVWLPLSWGAHIYFWRCGRIFFTSWLNWAH